MTPIPKATKEEPEVLPRLKPFLGKCPKDHHAEKSEHGRPKLLSSESSACKVGLWLASRNYGFGRVPTINGQEWLTVPKLFVQIIWFYAEHLVSFWESGIWLPAWQRQAE